MSYKRTIPLTQTTIVSTMFMSYYRIRPKKKKWKNKKSDIALIIWIRDEKKSNWFLKLLHIITTVCLMVVDKHITKISLSEN